MAVRECDMAVEPSCRVLDGDIPRPATLIAGGLISLLILSVLLVLPRSSGGDRPSEAAIAWNHVPHFTRNRHDRAMRRRRPLGRGPSGALILQSSRNSGMLLVPCCRRPDRVRRWMPWSDGA
jgi:hypothetical protein